MCPIFGLHCVLYSQPPTVQQQQKKEKLKKYCIKKFKKKITLPQTHLYFLVGFCCNNLHVNIKKKKKKMVAMETIKMRKEKMILNTDDKIFAMAKSKAAFLICRNVFKKKSYCRSI